MTRDNLDYTAISGHSRRRLQLPVIYSHSWVFPGIRFVLMGMSFITGFVLVNGLMILD